MVKSSDELYPILKRSMDEVDLRDPVYGQHWKGEDYDTLFSNIKRKYFALEYMHKNGGLKTLKGLEQFLDMIAYCAFYYRRLEIENEDK